MTRLSLLFLAAGGLAACAGADTPTAPSQPPAVNAATTHNRQRELVIEDAVFTNPCNGESIQIHINQLFVLHELTIEGKLFHGHLTFLDRGTRGVGLTTGAVYHQVGAEQEFFHLKGEVNVSRRIHNTISLISQGSVPNSQFVEVFRFKVSPAGAVTLEFDKVRGVCRG
jgi:hypothetical protein